MAKSSSTQVSFSILDREYRLACDESEVKDLKRAVGLLEEKMRQMRQEGNVIGSERIAVMTAIHLAHELYTYQRGQEEYTDYVEGKLRNMGTKVASALQDVLQPAKSSVAPMESPPVASSVEPVGATRETE